MSAARSVGMAVIGSSGHAARVSAPTIAAAPGARLVGVLGSTPERGRALAAGHPGCRAYANLDELCADPEVEAVWIAGPNDRHVEHAARCLAAGKHVLLEKPMATTLAGAERLLELSLGTRADVDGRIPAPISSGAIGGCARRGARSAGRRRSPAHPSLLAVSVLPGDAERSGGVLAVLAAAAAADGR